MIRTTRRPLTLLLLIASLALAALTGCERSPDDLEAWRNAEGGFEKMQAWATSPEEPMPVRVKAVQILIEERQTSDLFPTFEGIEDPQAKAQIIEGVLPTLEAMWAKQDFPSMEEVEAKGGQMEVGDSAAVVAKDAAFFLQPHAQGQAKEKLEAILAEWMSEDQDLRTQLGSTTIGQIAPRSGPKGVDAMLAWFEKTDKPARVARMIREGASDEVKGALAEALRKRAEAEHPELSEELEVAVLETEHDAIVPYLEKAIADPQSPDRLVDGAMDALIRIREERATPFFAKMVGETRGLKRWVSAQRLVELRGKAGVLAAANALPLEMDTYPPVEEEGFKEDVEVFCNFVSTEMAKLGVEGIDDVLIGGLQSERWPVQVVALRCAETTKASGVEPQVEALRSSDQPLPGWGEPTTIGDVAESVAATL